MRQRHQREREGIPLPVHHGSVTARVENFDALDSDSFNLDLDDAYDIQGRLFDEFTIGYCRLSTDVIDMSREQALKLYDDYVAATKSLMMDKNTDYGEAWRDMRVSSYTDLILTKIQRIKEIENHNGATLVSEGIDANYQDMINYAVFALIKHDEQQVGQ